MKRIVFALSVLGAGWLALPEVAQAQVKPELNTAPPGAPPRPTPTEPAPRPAVPVPAPTDEPLPAPTVKPTPNSPSGLEFPKGTTSADQPKPLRRYFLYSNFGLGYNGYGDISQFNASIAPAIGYRVTDRFAFGPGISYSYTNYGFSRYLQSRGYPKDLSSNNIGVKAFAQYMLLKDLGIFLHGEYEVTRAEYPDVDASGTQLITRRTIVRTPLAGAGYRQQFSDRAAADISILYNFNDGLSDIYGQPVIRFSFLFDLK
ncbi:hypothetical protein [Hymenobacter persicinus]|uniref:Outer membrane protein beta-barrel domain-containing protein n=1 Tax=Hymenobacter persicinus TaxID=2025506 RepID=A0A4Q5L684_9BACT|nr:hypothetical protein [Hymenobacter persicinus]RYU74175.1 hypothetical protein EWM57_20510 [Hymenobacter persicinus]